jgi:cyclohexanecarboxylate-CoA ligase
MSSTPVIGVVDEFPLTGLGKVATSELARQIAGGTR